MYHYVTICVVMRDCESASDAEIKCSSLMPHNPDENTMYMESWEVVEVREVKPQVLAP
jgi:hypothetical protein